MHDFVYALSSFQLQRTRSVSQSQGELFSSEGSACTVRNSNSREAQHRLSAGSIRICGGENGRLCERGLGERQGVSRADAEREVSYKLNIKLSLFVQTYKLLSMPRRDYNTAWGRTHCRECDARGGSRWQRGIVLGGARSHMFRILDISLDTPENMSLRASR